MWMRHSGGWVSQGNSGSGAFLSRQQRTEVKTSAGEIGSRITPILKRHGVIHAAIFGSFARGQEGESSDLDVLVEFGAGKSLLDLVSLKRRHERRADS